MTKRHRQVEIISPVAGGARSTPAFVSRRAVQKKGRVASSSSSSSESESSSSKVQGLQAGGISSGLGSRAVSDPFLAEESFSSHSDEDFDTSDVGDDGNDDERQDNSSLDDGSGSDEEDLEGEDGHDSGDDDDDDDAKEITVHFDVNVMQLDDAGRLYHLLDQLVPDHMEEVDRDQLAAALLASPYTSVVKLGGEQSTDESSGDVFGLFSIIDVAHAVRVGPHKKAFAALTKLLKEKVWSSVEPGIPAVDVLSAFEDANSNNKSNTLMIPAEERRSKAVLLVQEYIRNVPLELTSRILQHSMSSFRSDMERWAKKRDKSIPLFTVSPCMMVILAKIQRAVDSGASKKVSANADSPVKKKARKEQQLQQATSAERGEGGNPGKMAGLDLSEYVFWREEDEVLYSFRDKRVAVAGYRCRAQYDNQPQSEIPISLLFAVTNEGLEQAIAVIKSRETIAPIAS